MICPVNADAARRMMKYVPFGVEFDFNREVIDGWYEMNKRNIFDRRRTKRLLKQAPKRLMDQNLLASGEALYRIVRAIYTKEQSEK